MDDTDAEQTIEVPLRSFAFWQAEMAHAAERAANNPAHSGDGVHRAHTQMLDAIHEFHTDDGSTPLEAWEAHNESFQYAPPEKPADAWSTAERQELYDRVIRREVQWLCDKCTGRGPIRSLEKARQHVEHHHGSDLIEQYATPRGEQDPETDGGTEPSETERRAAANHDLTDFDTE